MVLPRRALGLALLVAARVPSCKPPRGGEAPQRSPTEGPKVEGSIHMSGRTSQAAEPKSSEREPRPLGARDLTADFEVPPGFAVTLFAESPQLRNPSAMDVDERGRVWVTEAVNYRQWEGRNPGLHHDAGDRVMILEDEDGDGDADSSKVFVQDPDLVSPLGIAVIADAKDPKRKRVLVSCSPTIWEYVDADGDDVPDEKRVFLTGFGGPNHDHGVHSIVVGPDGRFYFAAGNAGPHVVTDKSGWTLRSGSIYRGGGEHEADNHPGLVSDDGKVWVGGLILRCEPDGTKLTVMAHNFRNQYEVALDSFGNMYTADNDDDGNACCRTTWVMEGGNYGYFSADGSRTWEADRRPGQDVWRAHWHQDDPGVMPAGTRNGAGGPTGVCVYEGELFGKEWVGRVLNADAGANCVYAHVPVAKGAGIELQPGKLIASWPGSEEKKDRWFRPSDVCASTDGSILVADWWDPGVGGHLAGDGEAYGRILRIVPQGTNPRAPMPGGSTAEMARRGELARDQLAKLANDPDPVVRREVALAVRRVDGDVSGILRDLIERCEPDDPWMLEAVAGAVRGHEAAVGAALESSPELVRLLRPTSTLPALVASARSTEASAASRARALDTIAFFEGRDAGEAMLDLALAGPADTRELATWWVRHNDETIWREHKLVAQLPDDDRDGAKMIYSSGLVMRGTVDFDVDIAGSNRLWLVVTTGRLGNGCDWADWVRPRLVGTQGELPLWTAPWRYATAEWGSVQRGKNAAGGPLSIQGQVTDEGIGTHAFSEIAFDVPPGYRRLRARAGLDDGGTSQGGRPEVEFQVWTKREMAPAELLEIADALADPALPASDVRPLVESLAVSRGGGLLLLRLADEGKLAPRAREIAARLLGENADLSVRALAAELLASPAATSPPDPADVLALAGDPVRGARTFFESAAQCSTCHVFHGRGGDVGPDLSAIAVKYGKPEILDAILHPSKAIAHGFDAWLVETKDGLLETGFLLADGDPVVLKDTSGKRHVLAADEVESRTKQTVSTMPDGVALGLSAQDLADLLEFLRVDPRAPGRRLASRPLFDGKSLEGWTHFLEDPAARAEDVWSVSDGVLRCKGNPIGYLRTVEDFTSYVLTLEWRFDPALPPGNSGVLMRMTGADQVWPNSIEAQLHHRNAGDIWNIGQFPMEVDAERTDGRRTRKSQPCNEKPLGEWNRYVITLDGSELSLEVNGTVQNTARWVAERPGKICLQSEGAAIQFRRIEITPIER